ncbi:MAG: hypothetical protein Q7K26_02965 [bacterium]|nr:hypothetical protein [bacterium]
MKIGNWKLIILILSVVIGFFWYLKYYKSEDVVQNYPFTNPELALRYEDEELSFLVDYPEGFTVNNTGEENVKVLVFSKKDSQESFQIFVMPYDEPGPITPERILIDQPNIVMKDPQTVPIAGLPAMPAHAGQAGEEALVFFSTDPDIGDVREVWFVHSGHLYQASTYAKYDELLAKVMVTFGFK